MLTQLASKQSYKSCTSNLNPPYSGEGTDSDSDIGKRIQALDDNDFVPRNAAVPTIAVPDPFDPAVTLERIQAHAHTWIAMKLLDPAFSAQLDRSFQSAISD